MKINYTYQDIAKLCDGKILQEGSKPIIENIVYDSRKISYGLNSIFVCLSGQNRDGHEYIENAYSKGVRTFLVEKTVVLATIPDATVIQSSSTMIALQKWASFHRSQFNIPVIGITGSAGKTVVKEWLYHLISDDFNVSRSPKSYNSQLGVALSLFEINSDTEIAIIEAGISEKGEMIALQQMIQPTVGVFTSFLSTHRENFASENDHFQEKLQLFSSCEKVFVDGNLKNADFGNLPVIFSSDLPNFDARNRALVHLVASNFKVSESKIEEKIKSLPIVAMRMETFDGEQNNTLLFDAFNLSFDGLEQALAHQLTLSGRADRILFLAQEAYHNFDQDKFASLIERFQMQKCPLELNQLVAFGTQAYFQLQEIKNSSILFKGANSELKRLANSLKTRKHITFIEVSIRALKNNLKIWRNRVPKSSQIMAMVKASSYGSELTKIASLLEQEGVSYLGVAYVDEGVELRKNGVSLPILVMNTDRTSWPDCIKYNLEPSVFSYDQMEDLVKELILLEVVDFPIHLKFDTGMHRLGFYSEELSKVTAFLKTQPEIKVKSVYSHLADADNLEDDTFTLQQLKEFQTISESIQKNLPYPVLRHVLNSEGLSNYADYSYDMVRLGIGIYGISSNPELAKKLQPVLSWKSQISQIKSLQPGETLGYGRSFKAEQETKYAIVPVGYADGFRRNLSNGKGGVYINSKFCPTLGKVCMDMIMVDITENDFKVGDEVEIIGQNQKIDRLANLCGTIPYEIMTSLSHRMPRIFVEDQD